MQLGRVRIRRAVVATGLALVALALPSSAAAEGWLPFKFASPADREADQTKVGVDKDGNVTAIWRDDEDIKDATKKVTIRSALLPAGASVFEAPLSVTTAETASNPQIVVTENGSAVATWRRFTGGKYKVEGSTTTLGTWNSPVEISDPADEDVRNLVMAMAANGEGLVVWQTSNGPNTNNIRLIGGGNFGPTPNKKYETSPYPGNNEPDAAVAPDGSSRYMIGHKNNLGGTELNLFKYTGAGPWPNEGSFLASPSALPDVAVAANGEPVSAWMTTGTETIAIKRGASDPVPVASPQLISLADLAVGPPTEEFPTGMVLYAWQEYVDDGGGEGCCSQVRASVGNGVTMSPPIELSDELEDVSNGSIRVAVGPDGTGYVAWSRSDGEFIIPQATVRPPGDSFSPVADDLTGGDAFVTDLVTAADGRALVGIQKIDEKDGELYYRAGVSIYEPPPPPDPPGNPQSPQQPAPPATDTKSPKVKVRLSRAGFAPGDKLNQVAIKPGKGSYVWKGVRGALKEGTRVLVTLDEPASLAIRIDKLGCYLGKPGNPTRNVSSRCKRGEPNIQHLKASGKSGINRFTYLGTWAGGKIKPGAAYEFEVVATDASGNSSAPQRAQFRLDGKQNADGF